MVEFMGIPYIKPETIISNEDMEMNCKSLLLHMGQMGKNGFQFFVEENGNRVHVSRLGNPDFIISFE